MPAGPGVRWRVCLLTGLVLGLALVPGCVDEGPEGTDDGDEDPSRDTYETCDTLTVPFSSNQTDWEAARIECEANVTGTNSQTLSCAQPDQATLAAATNLTAGEVQIAVDDADGEQVAEHRLADTEGEVRELDVEAGQAGEWTLTGERLEGFAGEYQAELACPQ